MGGTNTLNQFQSECLYQGKLGRSDLRNKIDHYDRSEQDKLMTVLKRNDYDVPK